MGGLRLNIQDELVLANPRNVEECYQMAIRVEEKMKRRKDKASRGRGNASRGRGSMPNSKPTNDNQEEAMKGQEQSNSIGGWRGTRGRVGGGRSSNNVFSGRCYTCNELGHPSFKFPKKIGASSSGSKGDKRVQLVQEDEVESTGSSSRPTDPKFG